MFIIFALPYTIIADWSNSSTSNNPISAVGGAQYLGDITTDGSGGVIMAWTDSRTGIDIYAQRINSEGTAQWTANGVEVGTSSSRTESFPKIIPDGSGGAIIVFVDLTSNDLYAQRINSSGQALWTTNGVLVTDGAAVMLDQFTSAGLWGNYDAFIAVPDGSGGVIVVWEDGRNGLLGGEIRVQRLNSSGNLQWSSTGVQVIDATAVGSVLDDLISNPHAISDGQGGVFIAAEDWSRYLEGTTRIDMVMQRVNSSGSLVFSASATSPLVLSSADGHKLSARLVSDGSSGAIATWYSNVPGNFDIYAQRINSSGTVQWTSGGVQLTSGSGPQVYPQPVSDGQGGAIFAYVDETDSTNLNLYAQRINSNGAVQWGSSGIALCTATGNQPGNRAGYVVLPTLFFFREHIRGVAATFDSTKFVFTWDDERNSGSSGDDIYAQMVDINGNIQWTSNGIAVSTASGQQPAPTAVISGSAYAKFDLRLVSTSTGIVITWGDARGSTTDFYAQKINTDGTLGLPTAPTGLAVSSTSNTELTVSWADNSSVESGYKLQRSTDNINFTEIASLSANTTSYSNTGLSEGIRYYYKIKASLTGANDSSFTSSQSQFTKLTPPSNFQVTAEGSNLSILTWTDNSSKETSYIIERGTDGTSFSQIGTVAGNISTYNDFTTSEGTNYFYRIKASNVSTSSDYVSPSNGSSVTTPVAGKKRTRRCGLTTQPQTSNSHLFLLSLLATLLTIKLITKK
ncbi:MAG: fibronectin type III domain-containing protein [Planctomycetes bacterium]|nr:fibronectin type III domain-containing protein [Planctomycetota bacterium]